MTREIEIVGVSRPVAEAIRSVYEASNGEYLTDGILAHAKNPASVLHPLFEWDDTSAAHAYRIQQAEGLVRRVKVQVLTGPDQPPVRVRAYVSQRELPKGDSHAPGSYLAIEDVAGASALEAGLLESITRDLNRIKQKYRNVEIFTELAREVLLD